MTKSDDSDDEFVSASDDDEFESNGSGSSSDFEDDVVVKKKPAPKKAAPAKSKAAAAPKKGKENKEPSGKRARATKPDSAAGGKKAKAANDRPAAKPAAVSDAKAAQIIKDYMLKANRPYSHLNVFDNLHGVVKKTSVPKILNQLCDDGVLQLKDFGKVRIYLANQSNFADVDQTEMDAIDTEIQQLQVVHSQRKEELRQLQTRAAALRARPTTAELRTQVEEARQDLLDKQQLFATLTTADQPLISKQEFAQIKQRHQQYVKLWKQRRRACNEMLDCVLENSAVEKAELEEEIGIENDAAVGVNIADH